MQLIGVYLQAVSTGSVLVGAISYGKISLGENSDGKNPEKNPVSYQISYIVPPIQVLKLACLIKQSKVVCEGELYVVSYKKLMVYNLHGCLPYFYTFLLVFLLV